MALDKDFGPIYMGICRVYAGDPTTPGGMVHLGETAGACVFNPNPEIVYHRLRGMATPEDAYHKGYAATATTPLAEWAKDVLAATMVNAGALSQDEFGEAEAIGGGVSRAATKLHAVTLLMIPESEVDLGADAPHATWLWRAVPNGPGSLTYDEPTEDAPAHEIEWTGLRDKSKPKGHEVFTIGPPSAAGIEVSL